MPEINHIDNRIRPDYVNSVVNHTEKPLDGTVENGENVDVVIFL